MSNPIVKILDLKKYFPIDDKKAVKAVDGVNLDVYEGEVLGLVGESGSGKSTLAYTIMGMHSITDGEIITRKEKLDKNSKGRSKDFYQDFQIVFQDPGSSLNPKQDIKTILSLPLKVHNIVPKAQIDDHIIEILNAVELPSDFMYKTPNSVGGGEKQLVAIARALCSNPSFLILDEPTSSLDVSIQAKILNRLLDIKKKLNLTYIFITHDLGVIRNISDRVAIMYLGKMCEIAPTEDFYANPKHPYTQMLLSSIPVLSEEEEKLKPQKIKSVGEIPSPVNIPKGCSFNSRCKYCQAICKEVDPVMKEISPRHFVRCHLYKD